MRKGLWKMMIAKSTCVTRQKIFSTIGFSLFSAWLLSFLFGGQVLYALAKNTEASGTLLNLVVVLCHFIGLFSSGFFIKKQPAARMAMIIFTAACVLGSLVFFLPFSVLWYVAIAAMAFFAGLFVASWGFYFKIYTHPEQRFKTAADVLVLSNIMMIFINVLAVNVSGFIGLGMAIVFLLVSLFFTFRLKASPDEKHMKNIYPGGLKQNISITSKPFILLCVFVLVITINSGFMYQVVTPSFADYGVLASYYWAIPYVIVLLILRNLSARINRAYILYIAMIMIGLSFVSFMWLDRSAASYLIIDTLMLSAFGVCDLFWWSIIGGFFDYSENPVQVMGLGLSMNVLGILIGGIMGNLITSFTNDHFQVSVIALVIIFSVMIMLPVLNTQLSRLLKTHVFLVEFAAAAEVDRNDNLTDFKGASQLTEKETEVVRLLLRGYTYKAISQNLYISENTMKYHIKNIYQKLNISNKMELIKMFADNGK